MENPKEQILNKSRRRASDKSADAAADDMNLETLKDDGGFDFN